MVKESGVNSSLHPNCHHEIVFAKLNLNIYHPPPYESLIWQYQKANTNSIHHVIDSFDWSKAFENVDVDRQVDIFKEAILNIMTDFILNKVITVDDREAKWMNNDIRIKIKE